MQKLLLQPLLGTDQQDHYSDISDNHLHLREPHCDRGRALYYLCASHTGEADIVFNHVRPSAQKMKNH